MRQTRSAALQCRKVNCQKKEKKATVRWLFHESRNRGNQFKATFLPSLYTYKVMAGFLSSPLGSKAIVVVTPL